MLSQLLTHTDVVQVAQASPAVLLGEGYAHHAHIGQLVPGLLGEALVLVHLGGLGGDLLQAEVMEHVKDFLFLFAKVEIHSASVLSSI